MRLLPQITPPRNVETREHLATVPFRCTHCNRLERSQFAYVAVIIEHDEELPVDGVFCSHPCAAAEAQETRIVNASVQRSIDCNPHLQALLRSDIALDVGLDRMIALSPATPTGGARCE